MQNSNVSGEEKLTKRTESPQKRYSYQCSSMISFDFENVGGCSNAEY